MPKYRGRGRESEREGVIVGARINRSARSPCPVIFERADNYRSPRNNNEPVPARRVGRAARHRAQYFTSARATLTPG